MNCSNCYRILDIKIDTIMIICSCGETIDLRNDEKIKGVLKNELHWK